MVFKVPNKDQINFARSAFREILKALDSQRTTRGRVSSNEEVLPELRNAVTKPNVDPRKLALDIVRTGRVGGKKVSSNQRREIATINDYVNNVIKNAEEFDDVPFFTTYRQKQNFNKISPYELFGKSRPANRLILKYQNKLSEGNLLPKDINNINALLTMKGMDTIENLGYDYASYIPGGVIKKFLPAPVPSSTRLRLSDDITLYDNQQAAIRKMKKKSGKSDFEDKMFRRTRAWSKPKVSDVLTELDRLGIPRSQEIDDMIITLLPEWEGSAEEFVNMIRSFS